MLFPRVVIAILLAIASLGAQAGPEASSFVIRNAIIVDGSGGEPFAGEVLIRGERIVAVGPALEAPAGAAVIDAAGMTLIPGLFDLHTHVPYAPVSGISGGWEKHLLAYLYCGVTSVVDFGVYPEMFEPIRRLVAQGVIDSPRLHLAARIAPPGGHGLEGGRGDFHTQIVSTPAEARAAMRRLAPYQPDAIKVFNDGWRYSYDNDMTDFPPDALRVIVEEAGKQGWEVLTHTVTVEQAKNAARAGVNVIAHGIGNAEADDELIDMLKRMGTVYAPTLTVYHPKGRDILTPLLKTVIPPLERSAVKPPLTAPQKGAERLVGTYSRGPNGEISPRELRWRHLMLNNRKLQDAGVTFGVGTDAGVTNTWHGWATLRELRLLVYGGLTPLEAIRAATFQSAAALHLEHERGSISPGKLADLALVDGRPHENIADIEKISRVWLGGRELDRRKLARQIAATEFSPIPPIRVGPLLDDFELDGRRSRIGTNWVNGTDPGHDHSKMLFVKRARAADDEALSIVATMGQKQRPWAAMELPLSPGGIEPVDLSEYSGVRFEARGEGEYLLAVETQSVPDYDYHEASFVAAPDWRKIEIRFQALRQSRRERSIQWTGKDAQSLLFRIERPAGESAWLEIDNIELF